MVKLAAFYVKMEKFWNRKSSSDFTVLSAQTLSKKMFYCFTSDLELFFMPFQQGNLKLIIFDSLGLLVSYTGAKGNRGSQSKVSLAHSLTHESICLSSA